MTKEYFYFQQEAVGNQPVASETSPTQLITTPAVQLTDHDINCLVVHQI